jgi:hypothetical protein
MGVSSRNRRAAMSAVAALWAVIPIPAMLGCAQEARAAPLETHGRLRSLECCAIPRRLAIGLCPH